MQQVVLCLKEGQSAVRFMAHVSRSAIAYERGTKCCVEAVWSDLWLVVPCALEALPFDGESDNHQLRRCRAIQIT